MTGFFVHLAVAEKTIHSYNMQQIVIVSHAIKFGQITA